jgi:hypothetical protein
MKLTNEQKQELRDKWNKEMSYLLENKHIDSDAYFNWWLSQIESLEPSMEGKKSGLDLDKLQDKLDKSLASETKESLTEWMNQNREGKKMSYAARIHPNASSNMEEKKTAEEFVNDKIGEKNWTHSAFSIYRNEICQWLNEYANQLKPIGEFNNLLFNKFIAECCEDYDEISPGKYLQGFKMSPKQVYDWFHENANQFKPVLPSEDKMLDKMHSKSDKITNHDHAYGYDLGFFQCYEWLRDQIEKQYK